MTTTKAAVVGTNMSRLYVADTTCMQRPRLGLVVCLLLTSYKYENGTVDQRTTCIAIDSMTTLTLSTPTHGKYCSMLFENDYTGIKLSTWRPLSDFSTGQSKCTSPYSSMSEYWRIAVSNSSSRIEHCCNGYDLRHNRPAKTAFPSILLTV
jgi:hypothetical protein